jgi:hypothetical protein
MPTLSSFIGSTYIGSQGTQGTQGIQGTQASQGTQGIQGNPGVSYDKSVNVYTATDGQTTFNVNYTVGFVDVYLNGIRLSPSQYTASNGTTIVLSTGASLNDIVELVTYTGGSLGTQGIQGPQGTQGIQGTQGTQGPPGLDGAFAGQGIQGTQGIQGIQGPQGTQGIQGDLGIQGLDGLFAGQGIQGTIGPVAGSANQVVYKDASNNPTGSANLTFDGTQLSVYDLNVTNNLSIGGTTTVITAQDLRVLDADIILGIATGLNGEDSSTDTTANHGGIAVASTEGTPLVDLFIVGIETAPSTYKKIMWFKSGAFSGLGTDAWLINYGVGIGSTQVPNGVRLAAGGMQVTDSTISSPQLNISGVSTISVNSSNDALRITQTGTGNALVVEDETNPDSSPFVVGAAGSVGIGTTNPTEKLEVDGNILASGNITAYSDETLKDNIQTISNALDKVSQLRGVEFDRNDIGGNPHQIGVIAQEVEKIISEVVTTHNDGIKSVAYGNLVALLIEAIKELKQELNELKVRLEEV